jgi:TolB protein
MLRRTKKHLVAALATVAGAGLLALALPGRAQEGDDPIRFKISAGGRDLVKLALPLPMGDKGAATDTQEVLDNDLSLSGFFKVLDQKAYLADLAAEGLTIRAEDWKNVGAENVIKARLTAAGGEYKAEFRLYEVSRPEQPVLSRDYRGNAASVRDMAHRFAEDVVRHYTGEDSFFRSRITFSGETGKKRRDVFVMDWDGHGLNQLTRSGQNILPAFAPSGAEVAYTSYATGKPDLFAIPAGGGRPRLLSGRPGLNMGPAYSPDGSRVAVTLSQDGNSEIYLLSASTGAVIKRLTNNPAIETSPTWSPDGSRIAFVSDRLGGAPQIFIMNADGSGQRRLTHRGNYNTTPAFSPRKDQPLVAFCGRDEQYHYDIFTVNADTGEMTRITERQGSNQRPTWSPDGRAIAYESSRGGIWVSTVDGRTERQVYKGRAATPHWGPRLP